LYIVKDSSADLGVIFRILQNRPNFFESVDNKVYFGQFTTPLALRIHKKIKWPQIPQIPLNELYQEKYGLLVFFTFILIILTFLKVIHG
jgi:hypothetical protein